MLQRIIARLSRRGLLQSSVTDIATVLARERRCPKLLRTSTRGTSAYQSRRIALQLERKMHWTRTLSTNTGNMSKKLPATVGKRKMFVWLLIGALKDIYKDRIWWNADETLHFATITSGPTWKLAKARMHEHTCMRKSYRVSFSSDRAVSLSATSWVNSKRLFDISQWSYTLWEPRDCI